MYYIRHRITTKTQSKEKPKTWSNKLIKLCNDIKQMIGFILFNAIIYHLDKTIILKVSLIKERHNKKIYNLCKNDQLNNSDKTVKSILHTVHNNSSYIFSREKEKAWSFGIDERTQTTCNRNKLFVEFDTLYQNIVKDISHLPVDDITRLKTKQRCTCEKYSQIKVPYQYFEIKFLQF